MNEELSEEDVLREAEEILRESREKGKVEQFRKKKQEKSERYRKIWEGLLRAKQEGKPLSEHDQRALEIRKVSLSIADSIDQLLHDPTVKDDPVKEAEVIANYSYGIHRLKELGIKENMHAGDPPKSFNNPTKMAEYVAGQVLTTRGDQIPAESEILGQVQEFAEVKTDNIAVIPTKFLTPKLKDFMVMRSMVNLTHFFLASDLEKTIE